MKPIPSFSDDLIQWYNRHKRDLPWRKTRDPYRIWISEIILQQTRVEQGIDYYHRFTGRFPDLESLANAGEQEVLKIWQGLGYYSRARNCLATARVIVHDFEGQFPRNYDNLLKMKGIGPYTAAAIASFAFGEPHPVVDGNVVRVISRLYNLDQEIRSSPVKNRIRAIAEILMDRNKPAEYNQAVMEFGALHCTPQKPKCPSCPFSKNCRAFLKNTVDSVPNISRSAIKKTRYINYLVLKSNKRVLIKKRGDRDIWANLYDFPLLENSRKLSDVYIKYGSGPNSLRSEGVKLIKHSPWKKHQLSHQTIFARFIEFSVPDLKKFRGPDCSIVPIERLNDYPVSKLVEQFIRAM